MLRHLITHFQQLYDLYSSTSPTTPFCVVPSASSSCSASSPSLYPLLSHHPCSSSSFLDMDESSVEDKYPDVVKRAGKSGNFKMLEPHKPPVAKKSRKERSHAKAPGPPNSTELMYEQIWNEFPEDLLEAVIARLPIAAFFRFRSVCQKWNSLLDSQSFSQHCKEVAHTQPWFYTITHENVNTGAIFDPSMKKWRHPTIPVLPSKVILLPAASAGGLVCFLDIGHKYFYVCNPLTQTWKELPPRTVDAWSRVAVGMILNHDSESGGYKILWVGQDGEFEVYDSLKNTWLRPGKISANIKLPLSLTFRSHAVSIGRVVYFLRSDPEGIVSYDVVSGAWKQVLIPAPPNSTDHTLAEYGGQIMLVGLLTKNAATCVCLWELQRMTLLWKEVDRMPNLWCLDFYGKHVRMTCLGNRGLLMMSLRSRQMNRIVMYDVANHEWSKVPGCVPPRGRRRQWITCGTAFYPCLTASP